MLQYGIESREEPRSVLLLGAHCDDIEIGCGGTAMRLAERYPRTRFIWVSLSGDAERDAETRAASKLLLGEVQTEVHVGPFQTSYFPHCGAEIKNYVERLKRFEPDLVLTHCRHDLHQDHRVVNELTWNTFRDQSILEYEIPKFDGDLGSPNSFVALTRLQMQRKCDVLMKCFPSQHKRAWFSAETFQALGRLRGIECNAPEGFAEAFFVRKMRLAF